MNPINFYKNLDFRQNPDKVLEEMSDYLAKGGILNRLIDKTFQVSEAIDIISRIRKEVEGKNWYETADYSLKYLNIKLEVKGVENIPDRGPAILVSNHPWGGLEGLALLGSIGKSLNKKGKNLKILGTYHTRAIPKIEEVMFFVDRSEEKRNLFCNMSQMEMMLSHLKNQGFLSFFPASHTSHRYNGKVQDPPWRPFLGKISNYAETIVPMWFSGPENGILYSCTGFINPNLRHLFYIRETLNKRGKIITLNIGETINSSSLPRVPSQRIEYIRGRCESLAF
jgi:putative hemolysin